MIEIQVCESIDRSISSKQEPSTYHVEVRFIPTPGAHSICFQGTKTRDRAKAEAEKAYVESVLKEAVLKKPKPLKESSKLNGKSRSRRT